LASRSSRSCGNARHASELWLREKEKPEPRAKVYPYLFLPKIWARILILVTWTKLMVSESCVKFVQCSSKHRSQLLDREVGNSLAALRPAFGTPCEGFLVYSRSSCPLQKRWLHLSHPLKSSIHLLSKSVRCAWEATKDREISTAQQKLKTQDNSENTVVSYTQKTLESCG
jgi:hypothetical protein